MTNHHGPSNSFKRQILQECKRLIDQGKFIEANHLFQIYFPEDSFHDLDKIYIIC
jgi:hypothetical protein